MKVTSYAVVSGFPPGSQVDEVIGEPTRLDDQVTAMLADGWQPLGGPVVMPHGRAHLLIQAMVQVAED
jgi:hypothetical protein